MAIAGSGAFTGEGDGTVSVCAACSYQPAKYKNQSGGHFSWGAAGKTEGHDASLSQLGKKTYGAERLARGITPVIGPP
jgi:hypothetical protein